MKIKMTEEWKKQIVENYEREGEHYYRFIKKCWEEREGEESQKIFEQILKVLEERRKMGIIDYHFPE